MNDNTNQPHDVLLRRQAQLILEAHQPDPRRAGRCGNLGCHGATWPCAAHRLAARTLHAGHTPDPPHASPPARSQPGSDHPAHPPPAAFPAASPARPAAVGHVPAYRLRVGEEGVFAGSWAVTGPDPRSARIAVGYLGRLEDWWHGWAVWSTSRDVVEAMVAEQHRQRRLTGQRLAAAGHTGAQLRRRLDQAWPPMYLDGPDLVVDQRGLPADEPLVRISPGHDGRYIPMGRRWTWTVVDPAACERVVGHRRPPATTAAGP